LFSEAKSTNELTTVSATLKVPLDQGWDSLAGERREITWTRSKIFFAKEHDTFLLDPDSTGNAALFS